MDDMLPDEIRQQAVENLIQRAMDSTDSPTAYCLIASACKLDTSLDMNKLESDWLELWIVRNKNRTKENQ